MDCAAGTVCVPAGLTFDFKVQASSSHGTGTTSGASSRILDGIMAGMLRMGVVVLCVLLWAGRGVIW